MNGYCDDDDDMPPAPLLHILTFTNGHIMMILGAARQWFISPSENRQTIVLTHIFENLLIFPPHWLPPLIQVNQGRIVKRASIVLHPSLFLPTRHTCINSQSGLSGVALKQKWLCNKRWLCILSWNAGWFRFFCCVVSLLWCLFKSGLLSIQISDVLLKGHLHGKQSDICQFLSCRHVCAVHVSKPCSRFPYCPLFEAVEEREWGKEEEKRLHYHCWFVLVTEDLWVCARSLILLEASPEPSFVKSFKGNALTTWFCPFSSLLATSLGLVCAPMIHEFISDTA